MFMSVRFLEAKKNSKLSKGGVKGVKCAKKTKPGLGNLITKSTWIHLIFLYYPPQDIKVLLFLKWKIMKLI